MLMQYCRCTSLNGGQDVVGGFDPPEGLWDSVALIEEGVDGGLQFRDAAMHAAPDLLFGQQGQCLNPYVPRARPGLRRRRYPTAVVWISRDTESANVQSREKAPAMIQSVCDSNVAQPDDGHRGQVLYASSYHLSKSLSAICMAIRFFCES